MLVATTIIAVTLILAYALVYACVWAFTEAAAPSPKAVQFSGRQRAFPVQSLNDGPGQYLIRGVARDSETDQRVTIEADSLANAVVKAELRGIIVTEVEKLRPS